ncbi:MAG TPA: hypothetical protein VGM13_08660 [Thermoanaerobaculia bacterium]|jgi:hypothetical protein
MKNTKNRTTPVTDADLRAALPIFERYFSAEQQAQIMRLRDAGQFEGKTTKEADEKTIATLAGVGLYVLGLDPLADGDLDRLSEVVLGADSDLPTAIFNALANEEWLKAGDWTKKRRAAELGETAGAKAEEAGA